LANVSQQKASGILNQWAKVAPKFAPISAPISKVLSPMVKPTVKTSASQPKLVISPDTQIPPGFASGLDTFQEISPSYPDPNYHEKAAAREKALAATVDKIRRSLDITTIFDTTTEEVRQLLQADRVAIYQLTEDWNGEFVAESVAPGWQPLVGVPMKLADTHLQETQGGRYQHNESFSVNDIYNSGLHACHIVLLEQFQAKAFAISPILQGEKLWGLLAAYQNDQPRQWQQHEVDWLAQIGTQMGIAIQQSEYLQQTKNQAAQIAAAAEQQKATEHQRVLASTINKIRQSLDLSTIFDTATQELRQILKADRVVIYRFNRDWSGQFIAESVTDGWVSLLEHQVTHPDTCKNVNDCSLKLLVNTDTHLKETEGGSFAKGEVFRICDDIEQAGFSDCYVKVLQTYQAKAYAIVALYRGDRLWGLLGAFQNTTPRHWQPNEVELLTQIGTQLGVALQQAQYLRQMKAQAIQLAKTNQRQKALTNTVDKIRQSLDIDTIFQTTAQEVRQLLKADRAVIYRFQPDWSGEFVAESFAAGWISLMTSQQVHPELKGNLSDCSLKSLDLQTDTHLQETQGGRFAKGEVFRVCPDIYQMGFSDCYIKSLENYQAKAYVIVAIYNAQKLWGLLAVYQNNGPRQWQPDEIDLLTHIGTQLGIGIQQAESVQQMRLQAAQLQLQATQLQKSAQQQRALVKTVDKIRQSLDINTIFQTTTHEVRQFLEVERVAIYRFYPDWSGEFVADSIADGWAPSLTSPSVSNPVMLLGAIAAPKQSGQYPRHETFVPILQGEKLWGLLVAYQTSQPRFWQEEETNLLAQVGAQLGVAIQQAELLAQTTQQSEELTRAIKDLQDSQSQLIQGEKMAGLGQLVAGVAHEINNPINFIHGNLGHVTEYTQDLLELVQLYHQNQTETAEAKLQEIDLDFIREDLPKTLNSMRIGTDRICQIVSSLRNFSRHDEADMKPVDIHEGIDSTLLILQHRLKSTSDRPPIQLIKDYGNLPLVECYPAQLNQVFMNILSNGIDALEESCEKHEDEQMSTWKLALKINSKLKSHSLNPFGEDADWVNPLGNDHPQNSLTLRIRTEWANGDRVIITIADNGFGMPEEVRSRIFDPFFTTKPVGKGTGLGLSISHQIVVDKHHGVFQCTSQPGHGTEFRIEIPIRQD
jgi:GAF domain-containing protein